MQEALHRVIPKHPGIGRGFWFVVATIVLDRLFKAVALSGGVAGDGVLRFELFRNPGIAFSLPFSGAGVWLISLLIICGSILVLIKDWRAGRTDRLLPLAMFVLGASSNLFDRIVYGFTIDYLIFFQRSAVNLADGMIVIGALWLILRPSARNDIKSH